MSEHARLSFSASDRWLRCTASVPLTEKIREESTSAAAAEGTIAHMWLERSLTNWLATGDETVLCDHSEEMKDHLQKCMDYVIATYEAMSGKNKKIELEVKVDLHYLSNRFDLWGTSDVIISSDSHIDVIDLKYGSGMFVEADTTQNRLYILGAMARHMKDTKGDTPWVTVTSTIMQPRYADSDGEIFRSKEFYPDELGEWFDNVVLPAAEATDDATIAPVAGAKQCQWCLAKPTCPAVQKKVSDLCSVFQPVDASGPVLINNIPATIADQVPDMDVDRLLEVHDNAPFIEGYLKAVAARIRSMLEARDPALEGKLKLVRSRQQNKWDCDAETLLADLTKGKDRITKKMLVTETVVTAPQALKLKSLKPAQKARLQEHITKSEGSLSIVPYADERPNAFPPIVFEDTTTESAPAGAPFDFL